MANRRIKISELPKIGYNQTGDLSLTKNDYLPIAVTNKVDLTVKTSMAVTTRELQRFVLQQDQNLEDETNTLTIGRPTHEGSVFTIKMDTVNISNTLRVSGKCIFEGDVNMSSITLDTGNFAGDIKVGSATYPSLFRNSAGTATVPYGLLVADSNGKLQGYSTSFASLASIAPITTSAFAGRVVTVAPDGKLSFAFNTDTLLQGESSITSSVSEFGNILAVSSTGGVNPSTDLQLSAVKSTVTAVTRTLSPTDTVNSVNHKFITSSDASPSVTNIEYHNSNDLNVKTVSETVTAAQGPFVQDQGGSGVGGSVLITGSASPGLSDIKVADNKHIKLVNTISTGNDASDHNDSDSGINSKSNYRTVFKSPVVLGGKHMDEVDLTDSSTNYASDNKIGPRQFAANIGEIRWNMYNGVPTLYLAVRKMGSETPNKVAGACHWYGVPLFGTIDLDTTYDPASGYIDDTTNNKHSYENLD